MGQIQVLLQESHKQYSQIIQLMKSMEKPEICDKVHMVTAVGKQLLIQQRAATITDRKLMQLLKAPVPNGFKKEDIVRRAGLLKEVNNLNKRITPKITAIKSVLFSELQQLKNGRFAIKGYQHSKSTTGRNINSSL